MILDNDYDIDDMQAIPLVLGTKHVAAIVQSEGYTLPEQAAPAVNALVNQLPDQPQARRIPIIVGGKQAQSPDLKPWPWLPFFRSMMNRSNGLLPEELKPWPLDPDYAKRVAESVRDCKKVSVLIIGTYTSFNQYLPLIKDKIDRVVIMGQPIGDDSRTPGKDSFNCRYDMDACQQAMPVLKRLYAFFVDIPRFGDCHDIKSPVPHCYSPSLEMVAGAVSANGQSEGGLIMQGLPGRLRKALLNNISCSGFYTTPGTIGRPCSSQSTWEPLAVASGPGGEMLLWDQSAALFLVKPELFSLYYPEESPRKGGKHYEPTLVNGSHAQTVQALRRSWTKFTNQSLKIQ
ncbi:MAG: nucleoside hydrolase [Cyanobacteriota bacterium]